LAPRHQLRQLRHIGRDPACLAAISAARFSGSTTLTVPPPVILEEARRSLDELDHVVFYDKPFLKFERLMETCIALAPRGFRSFRMAMPLWLKEKLFQKNFLKRELKQFAEGFEISRLLFCEHHLSHAASAFYPSLYEEAVVLTMDGVGEWTTTSAAMGSGKNLEVFQEIHFPIHSACCIRRSLISPGLRSTPVSTSSWDWHLTASQNIKSSFLSI
jgi:predicted NodU family carbamoyl transferase